MSIFSGIEHVQAEGASNRSYFEAGKFLVRIERVFLHEKRLGGGKLFIVETSVLQSDNPNITPGEQRNWVQSMSTDFALPRVKAFMGVATGKPVTSQLCNDSVGEENLLKGTKLALTCTSKVTKSGKNFTQTVWEIIDG